MLRWPRRRPPQHPLLATKPGQAYTDDRGQEWVALQASYSTGDGGVVLTATFALGGSAADPRVRYRL